jgi:hypothetical protein
MAVLLRLQRQHVKCIKYTSSSWAPRRCQDVRSDCRTNCCMHMHLMPLALPKQQGMLPAACLRNAFVLLLLLLLLAGPHVLLEGGCRACSASAAAAAAPHPHQTGILRAQVGATVLNSV